MSTAVQGAQVDYALHTLGWKAFQDLSVAVAAEVLGRPVQTFLSSKDGGRDGAFIGAWEGTDDSPGMKSTIQCKFTSKADATLKPADLRRELRKVRSLVARGLAHDYVVMANAGVSGETEATIVAAFEDAGVTRCRVFGRDFLTSEIRSRPRLRMMVPRLYGLGDLSQIIDERAYSQARRILSMMGDDLACFVTTQAHRQSVQALNKHRFVLLLGDPASGKSTIGASLAVGSLDDGAVGTVKITSPEAFEQHWNPDEPNQFFWVDDAFGATQFQRDLAEGWNARLKLLRAAVKGGARVLMTSRTYVWNAARFQLKTSDFPLFENSQVVIDVQALSEMERAQILYNHVKLGDQPNGMRRALKRFLPPIATNKAFLPETARRLGSTFFTRTLRVDDAGIRAFVEQPVEFLTDVLRGLDDPGRAAVALVFLHASVGVPSPVPASSALDTVLRLTGVSAAGVTRSLEALRGSLTLLVESEDGPRWTFKHPTVADAYAALVGASPELVELYVRGAKRDRLLGEVVCGDVELQGASVRVPPVLYSVLIDRLVEETPFDIAIQFFLSYRADRRFLAAFVEAKPAVFHLVDRLRSELWWSSELTILARLQKYGLLPDEVRERAAEHIAELTIDNADGSVFRDNDVRELLIDSEFQAICERFEEEVISRYVSDPLEWGHGIWSTDMSGHFRSLKDGLERFRDYKDSDEDMFFRISEAIVKLDERISELEEEEDKDKDKDSSNSPDMVSAPAELAGSIVASIFDDIDE